MRGHAPLDHQMLRYSLSPSRDAIGRLSAPDDDLLRRAFGCVPESAARIEGKKLVRAHQKEGHWFLCDCQEINKRAPTLFPTIDGTIQREDRGHGTPHTEDCVFIHDDAEQIRLVKTHQKRAKNDRHFALVKPFCDESDLVSLTSAITRTEHRDTLAALLFELLHEAKLDRLFSGEPLRGATKILRQEMRQRAESSLMKAAQSFTLTQGKPLSDWLATNIRGCNSLKKRVEQNPIGWDRPHGIFIDVFYTIEDNGLYRRSGDLFAKVEGRLSVFGEKKAELRPPYLVIGLLAHPDPDTSKVEIIRAYAHPCVSWDRFMPVDSKLERQTLDLLVSCRDWLMEKHQATFSIEKPQFDMHPDKTDEAHEICRPDFILCNENIEATYPLIVVETMGYDTPLYRERKQRMFPLFERIGGNGRVPVIEHDYFAPNKTPREIDDRFFRKVCAMALARKDQ